MEESRLMRQPKAFHSSSGPIGAGFLLNPCPSGKHGVVNLVLVPTEDYRALELEYLTAQFLMIGVRHLMAVSIAVGSRAGGMNIRRVNIVKRLQGVVLTHHFYGRPVLDDNPAQPVDYLHELVRVVAPVVSGRSTRAI